MVARIVRAGNGEAARYARQLAARDGRYPDTGQALGELLARRDHGMTAGRRARRMAVRLAAERAALPLARAGLQPEQHRSIRDAVREQRSQQRREIAG
jgi:hypothetical protein